MLLHRVTSVHGARFLLRAISFSSLHLGQPLGKLKEASLYGFCRFSLLFGLIVSASDVSPVKLSDAALARLHGKRPGNLKSFFEPTAVFAFPPHLWESLPAPNEFLW
jgi:hypothetical protein